MNKRSNFFLNNPRGESYHFENVDDLRDALDRNNPRSKQLVRTIVRSGRFLPGTRPYWESQRSGLIAMCHKEKCPHIFITASPADYHWESLARCMPRYDEWQAASDDGKYRISVENLRDNPHVAAFHFYTRWKVFFEEYLTPRLGIKY